MTASRRFTVGMVGARGYVGRELVGILERHAGVEIAFAVSQGAAGTPLKQHIPETRLDLVFQDLTPQQVVEERADAVILALGNGQAAPYVEALEQHAPHTVMVDVSADQRFNDAWAYGLPEHFRSTIRGARRVANPGCYATGAQMGLWPVRDLLHGLPSVTGISGYSGAGSTPNPRNDLNVLRDNVVAYSLVGHLHEREIARHLGHDVMFVPHVAPFFRGMSLTVTAAFSRAVSAEELRARFESTYSGEKLVRLQDEVPRPRDAAEKHHVTIGGFAVHASGMRGAWVVTLDNLLKGAATQAVQNLNLCVGRGELEGITP